jgi:hypothetical protein
MEKIEEVLFRGGVASSTVFQVFESINIDVVNDLIYTGILIFTLLITYRRYRKEKND